MNTKQLKEEISNLPVDKRIEIAAHVLETLNPIDPEIEEAWAEEAQRRLNEFKAGRMEAIPGEQFDKEVLELKKRFTK